MTRRSTATGFWKEELEDHNIEIDIVRIRAMTNCCRKFKTM